MNRDLPRLPVPALLLAGGRPSPQFAAEAGVPETPGARALADINGWPMIRYTIEALRRAETISRIILIAPGSLSDLPGIDRRVGGDGTLTENLRAGFAACPEAEHVVLATADTPFITPASVDDYVRSSARIDADACYPAIPLEACLKQFPQMKRTCFPTPQGSFTGGNLVFQRSDIFERQARVLDEAYQRRKNPLFLARLIGFGNVLKLFTRRLTFPDVEAAIRRVVGVYCHILITPHADLGTDVDRPEDLRLARQLLRPGKD
jgi:molybdopterin-guanine dinucleotide biosynthesis protein A